MDNRSHTHPSRKTMKKIMQNRKTNYCRSQFVKLLIPGTVTYMVFLLQQISDMVIGGQFLGEAAVAGISIMSPIVYGGVFISALMPKGTCILFNLRKGEFKEKEANEVFSNSLIVCLIISALELVFFRLFLETFVGMYNPSAEVVFYAGEYFQWYKYAVCLYPVYDLIDNMVYSDGDAVISTACNTILVAVNIFLSALLAYYYGVRGIGLATFVSYVIGILILSVHFLKKTNSIHFRFFFSPGLAAEAAMKSMPHASEYLFKTILMTFLNFYIMHRYGENGIVVLSAASMLINFEAVFSGVPEASAPITGVFLGEENWTGIRKIMRIATKTSILEGLMFTILAVTFAPGIPRILGIEDPTQSALCSNAVRIVAGGAFFESLVRLYAGYYTYILKTRLSILTGFFNRVLFPCSLTWILSGVPGMNGAWMALMLSGLFTCIAVSAVVILKYGRGAYPLICKSSEEIFIFDCNLNEQNLVSLRNEVKSVLPDNYPMRLKNNILLLTEESGMLIMDANNGGKVIMELDIWTSAEPKIIIRYSGKLFDITDGGMPKSFREYCYDCLIDASGDTQYLMTAGQNRVMLSFDQI